MFYIARLTWNTKTNPFLHYKVHLFDFLLQKDIIEQFWANFQTKCHKKAFGKLPYESL